MKTASLLTITTSLLLLFNAKAQTWKPFMDYDASLYGFEDIHGTKKDVKYRTAYLVDEENTQYSIVEYTKPGTEESLFGVVDNNTLQAVIPIVHKSISVTDKIIHVTDEKDNEEVHEFYTTGLKKIYDQPIKGDGFDVDTQYGYITLKDITGKRGVIDATGKVILPFTTDNERIHILKGGYFAVDCDYKSFSDVNTYLINASQQIVVPKKNNVYYETANNGFIVYYTHQSYSSRQYYIIDSTGKDVLSVPQGQTLTLNSANEPTLSECSLFEAGKRSEDDYLTGIYTRKGELIVPFYNDVDIINCNLFKVGEGSDWAKRKTGVYDSGTKKIIIPVTYYSIDFIEEENKLKAYPIKGDWKTFDLFDLKGNKIKK